MEASDYVRAGNWRTWGPTLLLGRDIHHATLGIIGLGRIGKEVAKRARGFDMEILAYDEYQDEAFAAEMGVTYVSLDELLARSDFVTLHCALTPETHQLIGREELAKMKPTAVLINAARGPVVDTDALTDALAGRDDLGGRPGRDRPGADPAGSSAGVHAECGDCATYRVGVGRYAGQDGSNGSHEPATGHSRRAPGASGESGGARVAQLPVSPG